MQYGTFDDNNKEYVIHRPDTPKSWSNYLGTTEYGAIITNNAGGYSFYQSAAQGRFLRLRGAEAQRQRRRHPSRAARSSRGSQSPGAAAAPQAPRAVTSSSSFQR